MSLTAGQRSLLGFLIDYQESRGVSPSYEEMGAAVGQKSKSGVHRLVSGLEERGYIRRLASQRHRCIEVLRLPVDYEGAASPDTADTVFAREATKRLKDGRLAFCINCGELQAGHLDACENCDMPLRKDAA